MTCVLCDVCGVVQLGPVEIGGWKYKYTWQNPPPSLLEAEIAKNTGFALTLARCLPRVRTTKAVATPLGGGFSKWVLLWPLLLRRLALPGLCSDSASLRRMQGHRRTAKRRFPTHIRQLSRSDHSQVLVPASQLPAS